MVFEMCYVMFADNETTVKVTDYGFSEITYTFHMRRRPLYYIVNIIVPCCLLSFIAVVTFVLPPNCTERLGLSMYTWSCIIWYSGVTFTHFYHFHATEMIA